MTNRKIIITSNSSWNIYNFRFTLLQALSKSGMNVVICVPEDSYTKKLTNQFKTIPLPMQITKINPLSELTLLYNYYKIYKKEKPDIVMSYTIKPNIYSSIAARLLKIPFLVNITGLGYTFIQKNIVTYISWLLYKFALHGAQKVFFHNKDDLKLFIKKKLINAGIASYIPGSGIDTDRYKPLPNDEDNVMFRFLLIARMLIDKGIHEYVKAASTIIAHNKFAKFYLLGPVDIDNPSSIPKKQIEKWESEGIISYLGETEDVRPFITKCECVVLPSYREGLPRTLIEAASMGKPLIATDVPGCRDIVEDGINGFLCNVKDTESLERACKKMMHLPIEKRNAFGQKGRQKIIRYFSEKQVIETYIYTIYDIIDPKI